MSLPPSHLFFISICICLKGKKSLLKQPLRSTKSTKDYLSSLASLNQIRHRIQPKTESPCHPRCSCCLPWSPSKVSASSSLLPHPFVNYDMCKPNMANYLWPTLPLFWSLHLVQICATFAKCTHTQTPPNVVCPKSSKSNKPTMDHYTNTSIVFNQ